MITGEIYKVEADGAFKVQDEGRELTKEEMRHSWKLLLEAVYKELGSWAKHKVCVPRLYMEGGYQCPLGVYMEGYRWRVEGEGEACPPWVSRPTSKSSV